MGIRYTSQKATHFNIYKLNYFNIKIYYTIDYK